jgi:diguanylate cyclase (GGDEF)-like protein
MNAIPIANARLVVVDDDPLLLSMATRTLRHAGFDVSAHASGEEALAAIAEQPIDLLLLDVMMPGIDGFETCRRLRMLPQGAHLPVLMLTGLDDTESIEQAFGSGATDFITKPINWTLLAQRVRYALRASAAAESVRHSRERLARAQRLAAMGNWTLQADGSMQASEELLHLFDGPPGIAPNALAEALLTSVWPADAAALRGARQRLVAQQQPYQLEYRIQRADGQQRVLFEQAEAITDSSGQPLRAEGITQDITERVQARERIRQLANHDETTGLPNQQFFGELTRPLIERARRFGTRCAVLHADIDDFKSVNDAFGHSVGDGVLRTVAQRLQQWIRSSDVAAVTNFSPPRTEPGVLARYGGNAFTLLITDLPGQAEAAAVCQRLLAMLGEPIALEGLSLSLTTSIGIAFFPTDAADIAGLTRCAEQALYAAKTAGRARYHFFDAHMNADAAQRLHRVSELRGAITQGQLLLHYQPKIDTDTGALQGAEALVRWQHPSRGLVAPGEFIALAEESGLILPLTDWVLDSVCRQLRAWADSGLACPPLSVNLSAASLGRGGLVDQLDKLMVAHGLRPEQLVLEVTESMLIQEIEATIAILAALRARGYGLSLDDFGTGYSSLSQLKRLPIDELKIDRSFVVDAAGPGRDGPLVSAIIAMGRELGLKVVAEGVESTAQSQFLQGRGCHLQQGYLFSRPLPVADFEALLRRSA